MVANRSAPLGNYDSEHEKYKFCGNRTRSVLMTNDVYKASSIESISAETVTLSAGAAGTTGTVMLGFAPVMDSNGANLGSEDNTSFAFVTGTVLTTEVAYNNETTDAVQLTAMSNGDYAIDYVTGKLLYKKATTGTSDTADYKIRRLKVDTELTADVNLAIDNVSIFQTDITDSTTMGPALIDANGHLQTDVLTLPGSLTGYAEDSVHNSGDVGILPLAVRNDVLASLSDTDGDYSPIQVNAKGGVYVDFSSVLGADMSVSNGAFFNLTDNTTVAGVTAALTALKVDLVGEGGTALSATNPVFTELTDGTNAISSSNPLDVQLTDGTTATAVIAVINSLKTDTSSVAGTVTNVNGGNRDAGTQTITLADNDPAVTSLANIDTDTTTIAGDTTSLDGKTPALGTALMAASSPVTIATNDTVSTDLTAVKNAVEIMDDWDNGASDGASVSGDVAHDGVDAGEPVKIGGYAASSAPVAVAEADRVNAWFDLSGRQQVTSQGYDSGTDSGKVFEVNPVSDHHEEETQTITNLTSAVAQYMYIDMDGYRTLSIQIASLTGVDTHTVTLEGTNQDDGTAAASCTYQDVTLALTGVASVAATSFWIINTPVAFKYLRIKDLTAGGNNDGDITCYIKKMY